MTLLEPGHDGPEVPDPLAKIALTVKTSLKEERILDIENGQTAGSILIVIAAEWSCPAEELILFRDGESNPVPAAAVIGPRYPHRHRHHVHRANDVEVIVHYQADSYRRPFKRFQTVEATLDWAISAFNIDPTMAPEFELARAGTKEELSLTEHIGHLAGRDHCIELDLVRGDIANG
jgi:hypothetical protein